MNIKVIAEMINEALEKPEMYGSNPSQLEGWLCALVDVYETFKKDGVRGREWHTLWTKECAKIHPGDPSRSLSTAAGMEEKMGRNPYERDKRAYRQIVEGFKAIYGELSQL